jgi:hypothetical protein
MSAELARETPAALNPTCAPWCGDRHVPDHNSDPACWSQVDYSVPLTLEDGYRADALPERIMEFDPPRIQVNAYRREPGCQEIVYLHAYRPSNNDHVALDATLSLTVPEAEELIDNLRAVIDLIVSAELRGLA